MDGYMGFGTARFRGAPVVLTDPTAGALAAALAGVTGITPSPTVGAAYRVVGYTTGTIAITDALGNTSTWTPYVGQGEPFPIKDIVAAGAVVLVYY